MRFVIPITLGLSVVSYAAFAQSPLQLSSAIEAGQVGERYDGYMGFAVAPSEEVRRQVTAINIRRRSLYTQIASQRGVTIQIVGLTTACTLLRALPVGEAYLLEDKIWRRRAAGAPTPTPENCR
ncbi:MAG TPA: YdbL family protein [Sphingomicrobium sp.]|nr:YdbL family protein [Sphingomicrobium sp.]